MPLKHWQAWSFDHLSRKPVPVFDHPLGKEMLPNVQSEPPLTQLLTIPMSPVAGYHRAELSTSLSPPLLRKLWRTMSSPLNLLSLS